MAHISMEMETNHEHKYKIGKDCNEYDLIHQSWIIDLNAFEMQ
jgi:hypothetical protein